MALGAFLLSFILAALSGAQVKLVKPIFDQGLIGKASQHEVFTLAGLLLLIGLVNFPARFFIFIGFDSLVKELTMICVKKFSRNCKGCLRVFITKINREECFQAFSMMQKFLLNSFRAVIDVIREPAKGIVYLGLAIWSDWQLTLVILIVGPLFVAIFQISGKKIKKIKVKFKKVEQNLLTI